MKRGKLLAKVKTLLLASAFLLSAAASASAAEWWTPKINVESPDVLFCTVLNVSTSPREVMIELFNNLGDHTVLFTGLIDPNKSGSVGFGPVPFPLVPGPYHCKVTVQKKEWIRVSACLEPSSGGSSFACVEGN